MKRYIFAFLFFLVSFFSNAQILQPVQLEYIYQQLDDDTYRVYIDFGVDSSWFIFGDSISDSLLAASVSLHFDILNLENAVALLIIIKLLVILKQE